MLSKPQEFKNYRDRMDIYTFSSDYSTQLFINKAYFGYSESRKNTCSRTTNVFSGK